MSLINPKTASVTPSFDLTKTSEVVCSKCGGIAFIQTIVLRKVSPILSENGKEGLLPIQSFCCENCKHVNDEFLPEAIRSKRNLIKG